MTLIDADETIRVLELSNTYHADSTRDWVLLSRTVRLVKEQAECHSITDVKPILHGHWKGYKADDEEWLRDDGSPIFLICSQCQNTVLNNGSAKWNYCPCCGSEMKGVNKCD